ncbi:hypothetical protein [Phenylobacterium sp.]|uniref:hypothetical protein n=1 Tax=Phenylobacterium sp. TaxID=1871053 RepID=UPI00286B120A|nr:hypothetical protein [Phenylobacterium sp.]
MIFRKAVGLVVAFAAIAAAAGVCVVALAFALYAAVRDLIGPAWGAASVAATFALIALVAALVVTRKARPPKPVQGAPPESLAAKLIDLARERPLVAAGAAAAVVAVMVRNPKILAPIIAAALASRTPPARKPPKPPRP